MGEKPTVADEIADNAQQVRESPTRASTGRVAGAGQEADDIAIGEEGVQRSGAMSSIQNIRRTAGGGAGPEPAERSNLNSSKSNIYREGGDEPTPTEASNLNLSKSNINREGGGAPEPEQAATVKGSKSNTSERVAQAGGDAQEPSTEADGPTGPSR